MGFFSCKHKWATIAIDERFGWSQRDGSKSGQHIVRYIKCSKCGERDMAYDDVDKSAADYAEKHHSDVASARVEWIHAGTIEPHKSRIKWVDKSYAPLSGFDSWLTGLKQDPAMKDLLAQSMVDDALGQLEVAIKLHINNIPAPTPKDDE
jgi:hypothetical protein